MTSGIMVRRASSQLISDPAAADDVYNGYVTPREDYFSPRDTALRERGKSSNNSGSSFEAHDPESLARMVSNARRHKTGKIGIRDRICCYQWTWFTLVSYRLLYVWCCWRRCFLPYIRQFANFGSGRPW